MRRLKKAGEVLLMITIIVGLHAFGAGAFYVALRLTTPIADDQPPPDFDDGYEACRTDPACH